MPELVNEENRRLIVSGRSRLAFSWIDDRWVHSIESADTDASTPRVLAVSLESDPTRAEASRVVSPTYQDLQFQEAGATLQALLVGQAGPHHFSAVFTVSATGESTRIQVDVADRCRGPVEALASTYLVEARSGDLTHADQQRASWDLAPGRLVFQATQPTRACLAEAGRRATQIQALASSDQAGSTRRFEYGWEWTP